jgi:nucleotide-binding universal stress UspA family protein
MQPFRHILVPTDFSEPGNQALDRAIDLAAKFEAKLTLLHVFELPLLIYATDIYLPTDELERRAADALRDAATAAQARWPKVESMFAEGTPWERILDVAKERGVDLIVMGTHGRHGIARTLLGSVTEKVVRMSEVPVLTVRPPKKPAAKSEVHS